MKILISAGPTREYIDPVRFISNPSTGKMGYLIAEESLQRGHKVTLVSGPTYLKPPKGVKLINVETAEEMKKALLKLFPNYDILVMSAAVSDWRADKKENEKIKIKKKWNLKLFPNPDILKGIARIKNKEQKVIGFALETQKIIENATKKLERKKMDVIIANTPDFFGENKTSKVFFIYSDGKIEKFNNITKEATAKKITLLIEKMK